MSDVSNGGDVPSTPGVPQNTVVVLMVAMWGLGFLFGVVVTLEWFA